MPLLSRKRLLLTKIESTYATDSSPAGTDAVLVRNLEITPIEADTVSRDLIRPYLGHSQQILSQARVSITFEVELAGSGTSGTASRVDSLLRACGLAATTTAADVTGTAQAGSAGSITLEAGSSSTDDYYSGMVITLTGGTGDGSKGVITDYNGTSKVATVQPSTAAFTPDGTSTYSIEANVRYRPVSTGFESATIYFNNDGILHKATGCRGTFSIYNAPTDTAAPATTYSDQATPLIFKAGSTSAVSVLGYADCCLMSVNLDIANEIVYRELVGCTKQVLITNRAPAGEVVIEAPTIAAKDYFSIANNDTTGLLTFMHGTTAGNQVTMLAPIVDILNPTYSDSDGIQMLNLPYVAIPSSAGNDELTLTFS
jgi:hypothetical protein